MSTLPTADGARAARVLFVEDDAGDALLYGDMLAGVAPQITLRQAPSLAAAATVDWGDVDCVLLDLGLPDAVGLASLRRLREIAGDVPIVVLTGHDDPDNGLRSLTEGAQDYLVKSTVDGRSLALAVLYAIERARTRERERQLLEAGLHAAENRRLERGLLPLPLVTDARLTVDTTYRPGRRRALIGGDFYDAVELPSGELHLLIGDVCGHGPDEAALGASLRVAWRALTLAGRPVSETLELMAQMLRHERLDDALYASACVLRIDADRSGGWAHVAGHPPPIVVAGPATIVLDVPLVHPPIGLGEPDLAPNRFELPATWSLLLYTDGLIDARTPDGDSRLGLDGFVDVVGATAAPRPGEGPAFLDDLVSRVEALNGGDLTDDVAAMLLTCT